MNTTEALKKFAEATNNELYDPEWKGGEWMIHATKRDETIEQFVSASIYWRSCTNDKFGEIAGFKFVAWREVQLEKGEQRHSLSVIDFGDTRYVLDCNLTNYI